MTWYSGKQGAKGVFYRRVRGGDSGAAGPLVGVFAGDRMSTAHPAVVDLPDGGALVAADVQEDGDREIRLAHIGPTGDRVAAAAVPGSAGGQYPQLARLPGGEVVLAYTIVDGEARRVHAAVVRPPTAR